MANEPWRYMPQDEYDNWQTSRKFTDWAKKQLAGLGISLPDTDKDVGQQARYSGESGSPAASPSTWTPEPQGWQGQSLIPPPTPDTPDWRSLLPAPDLQRHATTAGKSLAAGFVGDIPASIGSAMEWMGGTPGVQAITSAAAAPAKAALGLIGLPEPEAQPGTGIQEAGRSLRQIATQLGEQIGPEPFESRGLLADLTDPDYYTKVIARGLPFTAVGGGVGAAGRAGLMGAAKAALPKLSPKAMEIIGLAGAGGGSRAFESLIEAGQSYTQMKDEGRTEDEASQAATKTFLANLPLSIPDALEWFLAFKKFPVAKKQQIGRTLAEEWGNQGLAIVKVLGRVLGVAGAEGLEEGAQQGIQQWAQGKALNLGEIAQAMVPGAIQGALFGGGGQLIRATQEHGAGTVAKRLLPSMSVEGVGGEVRSYGTEQFRVLDQTTDRTTLQSIRWPDKTLTFPTSALSQLATRFAPEPGADREMQALLNEMKLDNLIEDTERVAAPAPQGPSQPTPSVTPPSAPDLAASKKASASAEAARHLHVIYSRAKSIDQLDAYDRLPQWQAIGAAERAYLTRLAQQRRSEIGAAAIPDAKPSGSQPEPPASIAPTPSVEDVGGEQPTPQPQPRPAATEPPPVAPATTGADDAGLIPGEVGPTPTQPEPTAEPATATTAPAESAVTAPATASEPAPAAEAPTALTEPTEAVGEPPTESTVTPPGGAVTPSQSFVVDAWVEVPDGRRALVRAVDTDNQGVSYARVRFPDGTQAAYDIDQLKPSTAPSATPPAVTPTRRRRPTSPTTPPPGTVETPGLPPTTLPPGGPTPTPPGGPATPLPPGPTTTSPTAPPTTPPGTPPTATPPATPAGGAAPSQLALLRESLRQPKPPFAVRWGKFWQRFVLDYYDNIFWIKPLSRQTGVSAYQLARIVSGAPKAAEANIEQYVRPVLHQAGKDLARVEEYMVAMRETDVLAIEPATKLSGGVTHPAKAIAELETEIGPARMQTVRDVAAQLWALNDALILRPAVVHGRLSQDGYQRLKDRWPHYIPFYRQGFDLDGFFQRTGTAKPADLASVFSKAIQEEGSERKLDAPLARWEAQIITNTVSNFRNDAAQGLAAALNVFEQNTGQTMVKPAGQETAEWGLIHWWENGSRKERLVPQLYARMAKGMDAETAGWFGAVFRAAAEPLRKGAVQANPEFLPVNSIRDMISAWFREGLVPFGPRYVRAWMQVIGRNTDWQKAARAGALMSGFNERARSVESMERVRQLGGIQLRTPGDFLLLVPRLIMKGNEIAEEATRVAVFKKLTDEGLSTLEAAIRTREVSVDFGRAGDRIKVINQGIPFLNAAIQGSGTTLGYIRDHPGTAFARSLPLSAFSILFWIWGKQWESNKDIPDYLYAFNWVVQIGEGIRNPDPRYPNAKPEKFPIYGLIPKGPIGTLLTAPVEAALRIAWSQDDRSAVELLAVAGKTMALSLSPIEPSPSALLPPALSTGLSLSANMDFFRGRQIVPESEMARPPEERYGPETSKTAVALGEKFKVSPRTIDFFVRDLFGGAGKTTTWFSDVGLRALGYDPEAPGEARRQEMTATEKLALTPFTSRFLGSRNTQENRLAAERISATVDDARRLLYQNPEAKRFALGVNPLAPSANVDGEQVEIPADLRLRMQRENATLGKAALDALTESTFYRALPTDPEKMRAIELIRGKVAEMVRDQAIAEMGGKTAGSPLTLADIPDLERAVEVYWAYQEMPSYIGIGEAQLEKMREASTLYSQAKKLYPNAPEMAMAQVMRNRPDLAISISILKELPKYKNPRKSLYWQQNARLLDRYFGSQGVLVQ